jgi:polyvinyl alcohol dehydrogenase (cytochrome)
MAMHQAFRALIAVTSLLALPLGAGCGGGDNIDWELHNWPFFGRDFDNSRHAANETEIGPDNVASLVEKWRWPTEGPLPGVTGTPAVVGGTVYFGTWHGEVVALNARSGSERWRVKPTSMAIDSSPCVTHNRVFVGTGGSATDPGIADDGRRGTVFALDRSNGSVVWSRRIEPDVVSIHLWGSPVYIPDGNLVVIGVASNEVVGLTENFVFRGSVVAMDADSGEIVWQIYLTDGDETSGTGVSVWSTAAVDQVRGMMFIGTGQNHTEPASPYSDSLVAIDYRAGEMVWNRQYTADDVFTIFGPTQGPDFDIGAGPNLFTIDGRDVVGVGDKGSFYAAFERDLGGEMWVTDAELTRGSALGGIMGTAAYHDGRLYLVSNFIDGRNYAGPASYSVMFSLDASNGDELWSTNLPSAVFGETTLANGVVYAGTVNGELVGVDAATGDILWQVEGLEDFGGGVTVAAGRLYVPHGFVFIDPNPLSATGGLVSYGLP